MNRVVLVGGTIVVVPLLAILLLNMGRNPHAIQTPMIGRTAPPFALVEVGTGRELSLAGMRGRPVVLNFWASWCPPCLDEHPALVATARAEGDAVQFVGVVYEDDEDSIAAFLRRQGAAYPSVMDPGSRTAIAYGVFGVPETFFIDAAGTVVGKFQGPVTREALALHIGQAKAGAEQLAARGGAAP